MAHDEQETQAFAAIRGQIEALLNAIDTADLDVLDTLAICNDLAGRVGEHRAEWVQRAREDGCTWDEIGASLNVSKQAAQRRYKAPRLGS